MRIAITGCEGFVGKKLTGRVREKGHEVLKIDFAYGFDVTDFESLKNIGDFDVLIHLAAKTFVPDSFRKPRTFYQTNVTGTLNVLELCRRYNARIIYTSTYVYGIPKYLPIDEKHPLEALNPYTQSKIMGEELCRAYHRDFGLNVVILRPFNIYGPGQNESFLIPTILRQAKSGKIILKDPRPRRDLVYIDDNIDAYIKMIEYNDKGFDIFNVGSGKNYSVQEIVDMLISLFPNKIHVEYRGATRKAEIPETLADINKITLGLGWTPRTGLKEGLKAILEKFHK